MPAVPDPAGREALLVAGNGAGGQDLADLATSLAQGGSIAVAVSGISPPPLEQPSLFRRVENLGRLLAAAARASRSAASVRRHLRAAGLSTRRIGIGVRNDGYAMSLGRRRVPLAVEVAIVGTKGEGRATLLEDAVSRAGREIGESLALEGGRVLATGTLMAELSADASGSWILRMADAAREPSLTASGDPVELLLASDPPEQVLSRLVRCTARGRIGGLAWAVEERQAGEHPGRMSAALWEECGRFLLDLATTVTPPVKARHSLAEDAAVLMPYVDAGGQRILKTMATCIDDEFRDLPRGWGHGDFHPGNLLVERGRLATVLDWDAASPSALPGLDVLHLIATSDPALRRLSHGGRCAGALRELVLNADGTPLHAYLSAVGFPTGRSTLEALIDAYWLTRAARDVRTFPDRSTRGEWLELNVRRPVASLGLLRAG